MQLEYFRMIDRVTAIDPQALTITAQCLVPEASPVFDGHFPGYPILPGTLMIETIAQAGGWLIMALKQFTRIPFLGQVKEGKARAFVSPGEPLQAQARLLHDGFGYAVASGRLLRGAKTVAEAEIIYRVMPFPAPEMRALMLQSARKVGIAESYFVDSDPAVADDHG